MEETINIKAKKQTVEYINRRDRDCCQDRGDGDNGNNNGGNNNNQEQVFLVYKFIGTPVELIIAGMKQMMRDQATQYFRRLAKQLHPDKNQHPLAKEAF